MVAVLGAGLGVGIFALVEGALRRLGIVNLAAVMTPVALVAAYATAALAFALVFYILTPRLAGGIASGLKKVEARLTQIPMQDVLAGLVGLVIGLILALLLSSLVRMIPIPLISIPLNVILYLVLGYLGITIGVKRRSELPIPKAFVGGSDEEPRKKPEKVVKGIPPKVLDTSVIIDGRIYDIAKTGIIDGRLVVPSFVLQELRHIADSSDSLRRQRGRRGLDILNNMQSELNSIQIVDKDYEGVEVDEKLILLAKDMKGKIVTNDFNLNKVATVKGIQVLNINQLANALKPAVLPGEEMHIQVIKDGKEHGQGIGYLDDGTMIVVDGGKSHVGKSIDVEVTSVLQTSAGRMVFAKYKVS